MTEVWFCVHNSYKVTQIRFYCVRQIQRLSFCAQSYEWWGLAGELLSWENSPVWRAQQNSLDCYVSALQQTTHYNITFHINKHWSSSAGPCPRPPSCPFPQPFSDTHLGKIELELLAVELGLMQLDASAGSGLRGAEVDPDSPEAFEHLESCLFVVDPKQSLEPLLWGEKTC